MTASDHDKRYPKMNEMYAKNLKHVTETERKRAANEQACNLDRLRKLEAVNEQLVKALNAILDADLKDIHPIARAAIDKATS